VSRHLRIEETKQPLASVTVTKMWTFMVAFLLVVASAEFTPEFIAEYTNSTDEPRTTTTNAPEDGNFTLNNLTSEENTGNTTSNQTAFELIMEANSDVGELIITYCYS
jgi:hypothetical protein